MAHVPQKIIFFKVIFFLVECFNNYQLLPQDFADSLASHLSVTLSSFLFVLLMTRMFFYNTIECLSPSEWPEPWEQAAEAFCFTDGTYVLPHQTGNTTNGTDWRDRLQLGYYYWIPYIFLLQAVILKAPDFLWHLLCDLHPKQPGETLKAFAFLVGSQEVMRHRKEHNLEPIDLASCVKRSEWTDRIADHLLSSNYLINFDNWHLFALYMLFKLLRLCALLGSIICLQFVFGLDSPLFGWRMASNSLQGVPWEQTGLFPRLAYCDVHLRPLGGWNTRIVQCALPMNMLAERLLLVVWFWLVLCSACLLFSAGAWVVAMLPSRRRQFALAFLAVGGTGWRVRNRQDRRRLMRNEDLIDIFTGTDRYFMLRLAEERIGLAAVYLTMDSIAFCEQKV